MNKVERHALALSQKVIDLSDIQMRLTNVDMAHGVAHEVTQQIKMKMTLMLMSSIKVIQFFMTLYKMYLYIRF